MKKDLEKPDKFTSLQKRMFGRRLRKCHEDWCDANPGMTKEAFKDVIDVSRSVMYDAFKGKVADDTLELIAARLGKDVDEMTFVNRTITWGVFCKKMQEYKFASGFISGFVGIYLMLLYAVEQNLITLCLSVLAGSVTLHNCENMWEIPLPLTKEGEKLLKLYDILTALALVGLLVSLTRMVIY